MNENIFLKLLCSLPVILVVLYFIPFLGICLIIFRFFLYYDKFYKTLILLLISGLLLLIPKIIDSIMNLLKINNIEVLNSIINTGIYTKLLGYSKLLITVGTIFLILSFIFRNIFDSLISKIRNYFEQDLKKDYEIRKENDLKMQEKRERAKNTHVVYCPYCGADNLLTKQTGTCKYCRRMIEYKPEK